jgi:hypothetical protein
MAGAPAETSGSRETGQQVNRRGVSIMPPWAGRGTDCLGASGSIELGSFTSGAASIQSQSSRPFRGGREYR